MFKNVVGKYRRGFGKNVSVYVRRVTEFLGPKYFISIDLFEVK